MTDGLAIVAIVAAVTAAVVPVCAPAKKTMTGFSPKTPINTFEAICNYVKL